MSYIEDLLLRCLIGAVIGIIIPIIGIALDK